MVRVKCSKAEREAVAGYEKAAWAEARERSAALRHHVEVLYKYLHGEIGDPTAIESAFREVDAIRYAMNSAISIRIARANPRRPIATTPSKIQPL